VASDKPVGRARERAGSTRGIRLFVALMRFPAPRSSRSMNRAIRASGARLSPAATARERHPHAPLLERQVRDLATALLIGLPCFHERLVPGVDGVRVVCLSLAERGKRSAAAQSRAGSFWSRAGARISPSTTGTNGPRWARHTAGAPRRSSAVSASPIEGGWWTRSGAHGQCGRRWRSAKRRGSGSAARASSSPFPGLPGPEAPSVAGEGSSDEPRLPGHRYADRAETTDPGVVSANLRAL